jgi:hypothetical protein
LSNIDLGYVYQRALVNATEGIYTILVLGDDNNIFLPNGKVIEGDFSSYDQSVNEALTQVKLQVYKQLGVTKKVIDLFNKIHHSGITTTSFSGNDILYQVLLKLGDRAMTKSGQSDTCTGNCIVTAFMAISVVLNNLNSVDAIVDHYKKLGIAAKIRIVDQKSTTFLKGIFVKIHSTVDPYCRFSHDPVHLDYAWAPNMSRLLKMGTQKVDMIRNIHYRLPGGKFRYIQVPMWKAHINDILISLGCYADLPGFAVIKKHYQITQTQLTQLSEADKFKAIPLYAPYDHEDYLEKMVAHINDLQPKVAVTLQNMQDFLIQLDELASRQFFSITGVIPQGLLLDYN